MRERPAPELAPAAIEQAKRGNQAAFAAIVRHYDPGLRALAFRLLGDRERMDDALQETYVNAFRALPRFRGDAKLGTWLYRIAYNACLDELESAKRVVQLPLDAIAERPDPRARVVESVAERNELAAALEALAPEDRAAVLMVDAQGFGYGDAAATGPRLSPSAAGSSEDGSRSSPSNPSTRSARARSASRSATSGRPESGQPVAMKTFLSSV